MDFTTAPAIHVSREAAERIRRHGGRLFLWQEGVGSIGSRDRLSVGVQPSGATFENIHLAKRDVQICVAVGLKPRESSFASGDGLSPVFGCASTANAGVGAAKS